MIALVFAVGGGSFAVGKVGQPTGKQGVAAATKGGGPSSSDKKSDKKIAAGQVKALVPRIVNGLAHGLSVRHATTADTATNATNATNAGHASSANTATSVGGLMAVKIYAAQPPGTATTNILSNSGFTITMACDASGHVTLSLNTPSDSAGSQATSQGINDNGASAVPFHDEDETNSGGSSVTLTGAAGLQADGGSQFGGAVAGGTSISGMIQFKPANETYATGACVAEGHAFIG